MESLYKRQKDTDYLKGLESKEGERGRLYSNNVGNRSPSLEYNYTSAPDGLERAFDILFDEVMKDTNL